MNAAARRKIVRRVAARLREPSTYAGLAIVAGATGFQLDEGVLKQIATLGMAIAGGVAMMLPEGG